MKRQLRKVAGRLAGPFVPQSLRQAWGASLYGFRPTSSNFRLEMDATSDSLRFCDDASTIPLRLPEDTRADLVKWVDANGKVREEWQALMREARSHRVLFDIGSFDGTEALLFCAARPGNRAVMFEPSREPMRRLDAALEANGLVGRALVRPIAIGDKNEARRMYFGPAEMLEIVEAAGVHGGDSDAALIEFRTLDSECEALGLAPDLIRMDVDACEVDALRGAAHVISTHRPTIIVEIHLDLLERRGRHAREVADLLQGHDYAFFSCMNAPLTARQVFDTVDAVTNIVARPRHSR